LAFIGTEESSCILLGFVVFLYIVAIITLRKLSAADYRSGFYPEARYIEYDQDL
jgi:hypothetical protein